MEDDFWYTRCSYLLDTGNMVIYMIIKSLYACMCVHVQKCGIIYNNMPVLNNNTCKVSYAPYMLG